VRDFIGLSGVIVFMSVLTAIAPSFEMEPTGLPVAVTEELLVLARSGTGIADRTVTLTVPATTDLGDLREAVLMGRRAATAQVAALGARLLAVGVAPFAAQPATCGMTVEVAVPDMLVSQVCERLQPRLPAVRALSANSPIGCGADTGHASWGFVHQQRATLGAFVPVPRFPVDAAVLEAIEERLPTAMRYWYARPVPGASAISIRAGDVGLRADDTVLTVALLRAAVADAIGAVQAGLPQSWSSPDPVGAAHWRAARHGSNARLLDGRSVQALLDDLDNLDNLGGGESEVIRSGVARMRREGTGADRQRQIFHCRGGLEAGLPVLASLTRAG
jgi:carboxylate-amine ligase